MKKLNLGALGTFDVYETGFYEEIGNDGRYMRHDEKPDWWDYAHATRAASSAVGGEICAHQGYALHNPDCVHGGDYGWHFGDDLQECVQSILETTYHDELLELAK